jgi:hypothetical protein
MGFFRRLLGRAHKTDSQELLETILAFIHARTWADSRRAVEQHPELLVSEADVLLEQLAETQEDHGAIRWWKNSAPCYAVAARWA